WSSATQAPCSAAVNVPAPPNVKTRPPFIAKARLSISWYAISPARGRRRLHSISAKTRCSLTSPARFSADVLHALSSKSAQGCAFYEHLQSCAALRDGSPACKNAFSFGIFGSLRSLGRRCRTSFASAPALLSHL